MKRFIFVIMIGLLMNVFSSQQIYAGEVDILVEKLVKKGVLTPVEAQIILNETKHEVAKEGAQGKNNTLPGWIQKIELKGDLRLRYQWNKNESSMDRHRGRYRFRWGAKTKVVDKVKAGFGFASGGTDPRSTNQTMTNTFETPDLRLDYAYVEYAAIQCLTLYGGKFPRKPVLWQPSDLLWDSDINTEGLAGAYSKNIASGFDLFINTGAYILDELKNDTSDPLLITAQPGVKLDITNNIDVKVALAYYSFNGVKGVALDHSAETNSVDTTNQLIYEYNSINPNLEIGLKEPLGGIVPFGALYLDYISNPDPASDNTGYLTGVKFGAKNVKKKGQWQFKYMYRRLEKDAWLDTFSDSDFYDGGTDVKGHELIVEYGLADNVILALDYYLSENITGTTNSENLFQFDLNFKF